MSKSRLLPVVLIVAGAVLAAACSPQPKPPSKAPKQGRSVEVVASAASSLTGALTDAKGQFEAAAPTVRIQFNFGSSGALQQQIEHGAPVDLFISAAVSNMDSLVTKGLVDRGAVRPLAGNRVVLIRSKSGAQVLKGWDDLRGEAVRRIAIGNPQHVPAGQYAKAVLESLGLWTGVQERLVLAEDVRQVLGYTESGDVDVGVVYASDAATSQKVVVVAEAPAGSHPAVTYPMAVVTGSSHRAEARAFADFLTSPAGTAILRAYGFTAP